jgi:protein-L-isoaspartate(D-aspartate) O-methyltransferase
VRGVYQGSGYTVSIFHHLVSPPAYDGAPMEGGRVVGIDHIQELVDWSKRNLVKDGLGRELERGKVKLVCGDGRKGRLSAFETDAG